MVRRNGLEPKPGVAWAWNIQSEASIPIRRACSEDDMPVEEIEIEVEGGMVPSTVAPSK